jgi:hypothetical protein
MRTKSLLIVTFILVSAAVSSAQCKPEDQQCLTHFVQSFPKLEELKSSLTAYLKSQPTVAVSAAGGSSSPVSDSFSTLNSLVLHNLKFHVDGTYSDTLAKSQQNGSQTLTPFQLTGVKFQPTISLTYEVTLDQLTGARHQWHEAQRRAQWDRDKENTAALTQLESDYLKLEQLRFAMLAALHAHSASIDTAFYKLKAQAVEVLNSAHDPGNALETWLAQESNTAPIAPPATAQAAALNSTTSAQSSLPIAGN